MAILAGRTNSARADTRLHFLAGRLEPYLANARVAEFFDAYRTVTVSQPRRSGSEQALSANFYVTHATVIPGFEL
jgi:hypothetical protein